jgi:diketogulonate reductase-like aldo/keto reductase
MTQRLIYGTAWKHTKTASLVALALQSGFRRIDTASQLKHYHEAGVGAAVADALSSGVLATRADVWLQTKFTSIDGQDLNGVLPYEQGAPVETQVRQSLATSLRNLRVDFVDSLILHAPMRTSKDTLRVWAVFEELYASGLARSLGISNCYDLGLFRTIFEAAHIKPAALQNRFYPQTRHDIDLRAFCTAHSIEYQSFWTLSANAELLACPELVSVAKSRGWSCAQAMYRFCIDIGITPLTVRD